MAVCFLLYGVLERQNHGVNKTVSIYQRLRVQRSDQKVKHKTLLGQATLCDSTMANVFDTVIRMCCNKSGP